MGILLTDLLNNYRMIMGAAAVGGLIGLLASYKEIGKIIRMARTSTSDIGSLSMDEQVEIVGSADCESSIYSPITQKPCVLWQVEVSEMRSTRKNSGWVTVYSDRSTAPFDVSDATGRVQVDPAGRVEILLRDDNEQSSGLFSSFDEQTQSALSELDVRTKDFLNLNKALRVRERYIEKGDQIYLLGKTTFQNGTRTMDGSAPLIVSDHSERKVRGRFIRQVFINAFIGALLGGVFIISVMNNK